MWYALPAEMAEEQRQEAGPIDEPDDDAQGPVGGKILTDAEEKEMVWLDHMVPPGTVKSEEERKRVWLRLPRALRATTHRLTSCWDTSHAT